MEEVESMEVNVDGSSATVHNAFQAVIIDGKISIMQLSDVIKVE